MRIRLLSIVLLSLSSSVVAVAASAALRTLPPTFEPAGRGQVPPAAFGRYAVLTMAFEPNVGQSHADVRFVARGAGYATLICDDGFTLALRGGDAIRLKLIGSRRDAKLTPAGLLPGRSNYFTGRDPSQWRTGVPEYANVRLANAYRGIDVVYYGTQRQLEFDFVVKPGADPSQIRFRIDGARVDGGDLVMNTSHGELRQHAPIVYEELTDGTRRAISGAYRRVGRRDFGFVVGEHHARSSIVIDPVLAYSTYLGGSSDDTGNGIAVDGSGNAYIVGSTISTNFPTASAVQPAHGSGLENVFVTKLSASGASTVYSTYLGGSGNDYGVAIAVDSGGNAYVTGQAGSSDFPTTTGAFRTSLAGLEDAFVAKIANTGSALAYSTYLGGSSHEQGSGIAVNAAGNAYVTGFTYSKDFPVVTPFQSTNKGSINAFVSKLNAAGSGLLFSTYLGGSTSDMANAIALDTAGNVLITGNAQSTDFPTSHALQASTGSQDAFVTKMTGDGQSLVYSTYLGGSSREDSYGIAVDSSGNAYITGDTLSTDFPTVNAFQASKNLDYDAFVAKIKSDGSALLYSTYLGGRYGDKAYAIAVDSAGDAFVTGNTPSPDFPLANAIQSSLGNAQNLAFVTELAPSGSSLVYSTLYGGTSVNAFTTGLGIAVDSAGAAYVTGNTTALLTTVSAFQSTYGGGSDDAFVAKFTAASALPKGDANGDGTVTVADVFYLINYLFAGGAAPVGPADVNGDGQANVADVFYLINYLFAGGPAPH